MFQIYCFSSDTQDVGEELDVELNAFFFFFCWYYPFYYIPSDCVSRFVNSKSQLFPKVLLKVAIPLTQLIISPEYSQGRFSFLSYQVDTECRA